MTTNGVMRKGHLQDWPDASVDLRSLLLTKLADKFADDLVGQDGIPTAAKHRLAEVVRSGNVTDNAVLAVLEEPNNKCSLPTAPEEEGTDAFLSCRRSSGDVRLARGVGRRAT